MSGFGDGEERWVSLLGNLRNTIRQEAIRRQLADHVERSMTVLDVGCGQGTQAIALAELGCSVTGVEPSAEMRRQCEAATHRMGVDIEVLAGELDHLDVLLADRAFDVVCAHGVLMYLDDRASAVATLARRVSRPGILSLTIRNGHALAMRPGLRGDWRGALAALDDDRYVNELGVEARADRLDDVGSDLRRVGFEITDWYGVRVFNDAIDPSIEPPPDAELAALLDAEDRAARTDPYRWLGSQIHVIARRTA